MTRLFACSFLLAVIGCSGHDDSTSPSCAGDADNDFLSDCEERTHGTDANNPDTDGDTYLDGDEVLQGKDPLDPMSRIYTGYWPYQRSKNDLSDPGFSGQAKDGGQLPRLVAVDQFGDEVDLYDFAEHDKPIVIDLSALWCDACKELAKWLAGEASTLDADPQFSPIVARVASGEIFWITVLFEDQLGNPASGEDAKTWAETFPNAKVAVLVDDNRKLHDWLYPGEMPNLQVVDQNMKLTVYERFAYKNALTALLP